MVPNGNQKLNIQQQIKTNRKVLAKVLEVNISIGAKNNAPHLEHSLVHTTNFTMELNSFLKNIIFAEQFLLIKSPVILSLQNLTVLSLS